MIVKFHDRTEIIDSNGVKKIKKSWNPSHGERNDCNRCGKPNGTNTRTDTKKKHKPKDAKMTPQNGDILLFRPTSIMGWIAALFTWSRYSHAAMIEMIDGVTYCLEVREFLGGRKIELEKYLEESPTEIEIWRLKEIPYRNFGNHVTAWMREFVGVKYGWHHVIMAIVLRGVRAYGCECSKHPPFCSEAVSRAYRCAGVDLRPDIADRFTLPGDLAKSPYLQLVGDL